MATEERPEDSRTSDKGMPSILQGVDAIIDRHFGCLEIGSTPPHHRHKTACLRLSGKPLTDFNAYDLIQEISRTIDSNWRQSKRLKKYPSVECWRFQPRPLLARDNKSAEKNLEKAIARTLPGWANQVPTASGLSSADADRSRNIDLVHLVTPGEYEFVELKSGTGTPLIAVAELFQYFALFLFTRNSFPSFAAERELLAARMLHLQVLAPQRFYSTYDLQWLEVQCERGFDKAARDCGFEADFAFLAFPGDFQAQCQDGALEQAMARRSAPEWSSGTLRSPRPDEFPERMRRHQRNWALSEATIGEHRLNHNHGLASWVLADGHSAANFFDPAWIEFVRGYEHRWLRSLISSQCLAVNLFGPLVRDSDRARAVINRLIPDRGLRQEDKVCVAFEQTPEGAPRWLGENRQATQVDVLITVRRRDRVVGFVLVEVKFTETGFGECRGWHGSKSGGPQNPDRSRCLDLFALMRDPSRCWLTEYEGRRYWQLMNQEDSSIQLRELGAGSPCPFRYGLYQLMRNRILADCMRRELGADWVDVATCIHPDNMAVRQQPEAITGSVDLVEQFHAISNDQSLGAWDMSALLDAIVDAGASLEWSDWMRRRYLL